MSEQSERETKKKSKKSSSKNKRSRSEEHPSCASPGFAPASDSKISGVGGSKESKRKAKAEQEGSDLRGENLGLVMEGGETSSPVGTPESRKRSESSSKGRKRKPEPNSQEDVDDLSLSDSSLDGSRAEDPLEQSSEKSERIPRRPSTALVTEQHPCLNSLEPQDVYNFCMKFRQWELRNPTLRRPVVDFIVPNLVNVIDFYSKNDKVKWRELKAEALISWLVQTFSREEETATNMREAFRKGVTFNNWLPHDQRSTRRIVELIVKIMHTYVYIYMLLEASRLMGVSQKATPS